MWAVNAAAEEQSLLKTNQNIPSCADSESEYESTAAVSLKPIWWETLTVWIYKRNTQLLAVAFIML